MQRSLSHKVKRVTVTACDLCRLRKQKCNAKDLSQGEKCVYCYRNGHPCTFDDRDEQRSPSGSGSMSPRTRDQAATAHHAGKNVYLKQPSLPTQSLHNNRSNVAQHHGSASQPIYPDGHLSAKAGAAREASWYPSGPSASYLPPTLAVWDMWNVPNIITNSMTGQRAAHNSSAIVEFLLHRFYQQPSFNQIIVPCYSELVGRLKYGIPTPIPAYLLHTMVACAAASSLTTEAELRLWQSHVWHGCTESVHNRLSRSGAPELELVQALLLLSSNWPGAILRVERINTLDTAISLATSLQLHSGRHLDIAPGPRSTRIVLFWSLYCADKLMAIMTHRPPSIPSESHSVPMPSVEDIEAASGMQPKTTIAAWLQRLVHAFITLSHISEGVQVQLLLPMRQRQLSTLEQVFRRILPLEKRLESFCKEQRWLLGRVSQLSPLCRTLADAVISQLHFTQLHLYLPALQFEVDRRDGALRFSPENDKPLAATIESAWHLLQQPMDGHRNHPSSTTTPSSTSVHMKLAAMNCDPNTCLSFSHACGLIGVNFFRFLAAHWADWDGGRGCLRYAPVQITDISLKPQQPSSKPMIPAPHQQAKSTGIASAKTTDRQGDASSTQEKCTSRTADASQAPSQLSRKAAPFPLHLDKKVDQATEAEGQDDKYSKDQDEEQSATHIPPNTPIDVSTPARVLFREQRGEMQQMLDSQQNQKASSGQAELEKETVTIPSSHAMLTPIRLEFLQQGVQGPDPLNDPSRSW